MSRGGNIPGVAHLQNELESYLRMEPALESLIRTFQSRAGSDLGIHHIASRLC